MQRYVTPVDNSSREVCIYDVSSFNANTPSKEAPYNFTDDSVEKVSVEISGIERNSTDHPESVSFDPSQKTISIKYSDWGLVTGTRHVVIIRLHQTNVTEPKTIVGPFHFTQIVVVPF